MKYLLDTVVFLRIISGENARLSQKALAAIEDPQSELSLSAVSIWEISIKYSIGKLDLKKNPREWLPEVILKMGLRSLPVTQRHAFEVMKLPFHHRDPFDRLLVCQTKLEGLRLITPDAVLKKYKIPVVW